jgi:hypothetical protein
VCFEKELNGEECLLIKDLVEGNHQNNRNQNHNWREAEVKRGEEDDGLR